MNIEYIQINIEPWKTFNNMPIRAKTKKYNNTWAYKFQKLELPN